MTDENNGEATMDAGGEAATAENGTAVAGDGGAGEENGWDGFLSVDDRPEGVPDNYWDAERGGVKVGAALKRAGDLQRKITELTTPKAPADEYAFNPPEHLVGHVEGDTPLAKRTFDWAKKYDLPQVAVDELTAAFYADLPTVDGLTQALAGEHGDHAAAVIGANDKWLKTLPDDGIRDAMDTLMLTPDGHRALKYIREHLNGGRAIDDRAAPATEPEVTYEDILALKSKPEYWRDHDPAIMKQVKAGLEKLFPGESGPATSGPSG